MLVRLPTFQVQSLDVHRGDGKGSPSVRATSGSSRSRHLAVADEVRVGGVLGQIAGLRVPDGGFAADDAKDLAAYGLKEPLLTITLTPRGSDPVSQTIAIGKPVPTSGVDETKTRGVRYYARRDDQDDVVIVDAGILQNLGANPLDLHGKKVANVQPERVDAVRLTSDGATVVAAKRERGWERIEPPRPGRRRGDRDHQEDRGRPGERPLRAGQGLGPAAREAAGGDRALAGLRPEARPGARVGADEGAADQAGGRPPRPGRGTVPRVAGDPVVMALPISFLEGLSFGGLAFRDRQVAAASPPRVERVTVIRGPLRSSPRPPDGNPAAGGSRSRPRPGDPETIGLCPEQARGPPGRVARDRQARVGREVRAGQAGARAQVEAPRRVRPGAEAPRAGRGDHPERRAPPCRGRPRRYAGVDEPDRLTLGPEIVPCSIPRGATGRLSPSARSRQTGSRSAGRR